MEIDCAPTAALVADALALIVPDPRLRAPLLAEAQAGRFDRSAWALGRQAQQIVAAAWGQAFPGSIALLWPPYLGRECTPRQARQLVLAIEPALVAHGVRLIQCLMPPEERPVTQVLGLAQYQRAADLLYLYCSSTDADCPDLGPLQMIPGCEVPTRRLTSVVDATYQGTLDCPALNGLRPAAEVLEGYRSLGVSGDQLWWLVHDTETGTDVGCLFLADHQPQDQVELVYVGVVSEQRGRRWGRDLTRWSAHRAGLVGRRRLVLAVDADNRPALNMYLDVGMQSWDSRRVFLKPLTVP